MSDSTLLRLPGGFSYLQAPLSETAQGGGNPSSSMSATATTTSKRNREDDDDFDDKDDGVGGDDALSLVMCQVKSTSAQQHSLNFDLNAAYHRFVQAVSKKLEAESGASLQLPTAKGDTLVRLTGTDKSRVAALKVAIDALIQETILTEKLDFTHFISLPIAEDSVLERHADFVTVLAATTLPNAVDDQPKAPLSLQEKRRHLEDKLRTRGINVAYPEELHLTVCMLRLPTEALILRARAVLRDTMQIALKSALDNRSVICEFKGLNTFENATNARVLHTAPQWLGDANVRMSNLTQLLINACKEAKLIPERESDSVKFHMTLLRLQRPQVKPTQLLARFAVNDFGQAKLHSVHLSRRFAHERGKSYYYCEEMVAMPE